MILEGLFPVFALLLLGHLLRRFGLTSESFLKASDRLVYFIFFPALLFWKIGGASPPTTETWNLCGAAFIAVFVIYGASTLFIVLFKVPRFKAGSFSQSCYRFNTYIGMAVIVTAVGEAGIKHFGILIGLIIPVVNVMAVSTLIWFSDHSYSMIRRMKFTAIAVISNPLIIACVAGMLYSQFASGFPGFIDNTLGLFSYVTLPLALLSIGGELTFKRLRGNFNLSLAASVFKLLIYPAMGYLFLSWFHVTGVPFKTGMIFFALPTSPAIYVLSSQLSSDTALASAAIVLSTILSFISLSFVLTI
ncbi:Auxin efflux carrier family protein [Olavius algarvensis associated proteobacterium Delta 3]|nr:Auxin efflux carrier family protein [Olavius algarvensis associated proteobacterium Delta 3]CAB5112592.1 Auxin efflux carrier family protein [Olavius algarvensis associated proteobacterium Delta 3]